MLYSWRGDRCGCESKTALFCLPKTGEISTAHLIQDSFLNLKEYNASYRQRQLTTAKLPAQVVLANLVLINWLDHPSFQNPTWARTDTVTNNDINNCAYNLLKAIEAEAPDNGKGRYISSTRLRCLTNYNALVCWQIRTLWAFQKVGSLQKSVCARQTENRGDAIIYSMWNNFWTLKHVNPINKLINL